MHKKEEVNGARRIKSEKYKEQKYQEKRDISLESKIIEWNEIINVEQMQEQVNQPVGDIAREVCDSIRVGEGYQER